MFKLVCTYITLSTLLKPCITVNFVVIIVNLIPKNQMLFLFIYILWATNFKVALVPVWNYLIKIKVFLIKKKINKNLFWNKAVLWHISCLGVVISLLFGQLISVKYQLLSLQLWSLAFNLFGVYWSAQENLWGGVWNWNLIEISMLLITMYLMFPLHKSKWILYWPQVGIILGFVYVYYNHIPVELSVHSFSENKLNKYTSLHWVLLANVIYNVIEFFYKIVLIFIWCSQLLRFSSPNKVNQYLILTAFLYYLTYKVKCNFIFFYNVYWVYASLILLLSILKIINRRYSLVVFIHVAVLASLALILLLQSTYIVCIQKQKLGANLMNLHKGSFITIKSQFHFESIIQKSTFVQFNLINNRLLVFIK